VDGFKLVISVDDGKFQVFAKNHLEKLHHWISTNTLAIDTKKGLFFYVLLDVPDRLTTLLLANLSQYNIPPPTKRSPSSELESNSIKRPRVEDPIAEEKDNTQKQKECDPSQTPIASDKGPPVGKPRKSCENCYHRKLRCVREDASKLCQQCISDNCECVLGAAISRGPKKDPRKVPTNDHEQRVEVLLQVQLAEEKREQLRQSCELQRRK